MQKFLHLVETSIFCEISKSTKNVPGPNLKHYRVENLSNWVWVELDS